MQFILQPRKIYNFDALLIGAFPATTITENVLYGLVKCVGQSWKVGMLYTIEEYYQYILTDVDYRGLSRGIVPDKVSVALALASATSSKTEVQFSEFFDFLRDANECDGLTVYVDAYGRAVSYIVSAWCKFDEKGSEPSIWMAKGSVFENMFVVDAAFTEGTLSQSVAIHLSATSATGVTLYRPTRPRQYRTYDVHRIRRRRWPTSYVHNRFSPSNHKYLEEAVRSSFVLFDLTAKACAAMRMFEAGGTSYALNLSQAFPLVAGLLSLDQLQLAGTAGEEGMIIFAISNFQIWKTSAIEHSLARSLASYTDGNDIVVLFGAGEPRVMFGLLKSLLARLTDEGEKDVFIRRTLFNDFKSLTVAHYEDEGWQVSYSEIGDFVRISKIGG